MSSKTRRQALGESKDARGGGQFLPLPLSVLRSPEFAKLSPWACKLLLDLMTQYRHPLNNGDLSVAWVLMKPRGWSSKQTLYKARDELLAGRWITVTRQGGRKIASLYALTFYRIDDCGGKLDVKATKIPLNEWMRGEIIAPPVVPMSADLARRSYQ